MEMTFGAGATLFLGGCVFFAGIVDALAGGGGLITLPAYLAAGLDPALAAFMFAGRVHWKLGLAMSLFGVAGHWVGSHLGVKRGAALIRPVVALVCAGLFVKILFDVVNVPGGLL